MDIYGDHALVCPCGNDRTTRHNLIQNVFVSSLTRAVMQPSPQPMDLAALGLRPDIYVPDLSLGRPSMADVAVTCPLQSKYVDLAANNSLHAAHDYALVVKRDKYQKACDERNFSFHPLVVETTGGWCDSARDYIDHIVFSLARRERLPRDLVKRQLYQVLSVTLQRANSNMLLSRTPLLLGYVEEDHVLYEA